MTEHQPGWDQSHTAPPPRDSVWKRFRPSPPRQLLSGARSDRRPHVVIVGGGFGGLNAAKALRDAPIRITLVDARNYHLFQPLLYQVATASLSPADISSPIRSVLRRQRNVRVVMAEAVGLDLDRREVRLTSGRLRYDYLILAAGAESQYFGHPEWESFAPGLKSIEDAVDIRSRIFAAFEAAELEPDEDRRRALLTFVVIGGGPTGVELAGALAEIAHHTLPREFRAINPNETRILLIEGSPRILAAFPEASSKSATRDLVNLGVDVRTNLRVADIRPGEIRVGDERIATETVLWAAGVRAAALGSTLGVATDQSGRVRVGSDLAIAGYPEVFVIGDMASAVDRKGTLLPGLAPVAIQEARWTAKNIERRLAGEELLPFTYRDRGIMATVGRNRAVAVVKGFAFDGLIAWIGWLVVHVLMLIGFRNRVAVMLQWAWAYVTQQRSARLIMSTFARPPVPRPTGSNGHVEGDGELIDAAERGGRAHAELT